MKIFTDLKASPELIGWVVFAVVLVFSLYPTFADRVPGPISGFPQPFYGTVVFHVVSSESALGTPRTAMRPFSVPRRGTFTSGASSWISEVASRDTVRSTP